MMIAHYTTKLTLWNACTHQRQIDSGPTRRAVDALPLRKAATFAREGECQQVRPAVALAVHAEIVE